MSFAVLFTVSATATNISWNGAADALWSTGGDWVGGVAPVAADVAVFDAASVANLSTTLGVDRAILGLKITTPGGLITIGAGNILTLGAGGIDMSVASQNLLLNALVALAADQSWNVAAGRTLTANGIISGTNVNLNKIGLGDLTLAGANTFTGTTTIGGGTLTLNGSLQGTTGTDLTFAGTGTFNVSAASGVNQGMKVLRFNGGEGTVRSTNNGGTSTVSFTSRIARSPGATGNFSLINGTQGAGGTNNITIGGELTAQLLDRGLFYNGSQYAAYDAGGFVRGLIYGADANALAIAGGPTLGVSDATKNVQISGNITGQTTASVNTISDPGSFTITLVGGQTLSFNGLLKSGGNAMTISGGAGITTTESGNEMVIRADAATDTLTINTPVLANGNSSLTKSGDGTMIFSATNSYTGVTSINAGVLQIGAGGASGSLGIGNVNNSASLVFNRSDIFTVSNLISGNGSLTKNGAGTLTLTGANSFKGSISILSGVLSVGASNNLGDNSATDSLFINSTGTLRDTGAATSGRSVNIVNGSTIDVTTAALLTLSGNFTTNVAAGDVNLNKTGPGTLNINGGTMFTAGNTPNRTFNVMEGVVNFTNASVHLSSLLTQNSNAYITSTNSSFDFNDNGWGHGCFILGHGNNFYSATINGGSIKTDGDGIYLNLGGNTGRSLMTLDGGVTVDASEFLIANNDNCIGVLNIRNAAITNAFDITLGGSKAAGYVNQLGGTINNTGSVNLAYRMGQANNWGIYNLRSGILKTESITSGDGTTGYAGNRAYFNFHGGTLSPQADHNNFVYSTLTGANAGSVSAPQMFVFSEGAVIDTDGKSIIIAEKLMAPAGQGLADTAIVISGANQGSGYRGEPIIRIGDTTNITASVIANMVDDGTGNGTFKITSLTVINPGVNYTAAPALTIYGGDPTTPATLPATLPIAPNASGGLTKAGLGTLALSAANTYTGVTTISGGTLQIGAGGTTGSITTTSNVVNNGVLAFNRTDNYGGDFTRVISGNGSVKVAGGVLTLPGTNTYTGATTLSGGTLSVGTNDNFGNGGPLIFDGGTLQITGTALNNFDSHAPTFNDGKTVGIDVNNAANTIIVTQPLNQGIGGLTKLGSGKLILTGNNTYTGLTTVSGGTLQIGNGGSGASISSSSGIIMSNNSELVFNIADNTGFSQGISGAGSLLKAGAGMLTLLGSVNYAGTTTVNGGTLSVVNASISGSATTVNSGTLAGDNSTLGNVIINSGGTFTPGGGGIGSLTVSGDLNLNGSSIFNVQFDSTAIAVDGVALNGNLNIASGVVLNVSDIGSNPASIFDVTAPIITYSGAWNGGTFAGLPDDSYFMSAGQAYQISYDGGVVTLTMLAVIPEPGTAASFLGGLGLLLGVRRRRA